MYVAEWHLQELTTWEMLPIGSRILARANILSSELTGNELELEVGHDTSRTFCYVLCSIYSAAVLVFGGLRFRGIHSHQQ